MAPPDPQRGAKTGPRADRPYAGDRKCAPGAIRTHTVRGLSAPPPAGWATEALPLWQKNGRGDSNPVIHFGRVVLCPVSYDRMSAFPAIRTQNLPGFNRTLDHLSLKGMSPRPENRTRSVLLPKQVSQPSPSPRKSQASPGFHAVHCGVLKVRHRRRAVVRAWVAGVEPATSGFGDRRSGRTELHP